MVFALVPSARQAEIKKEPCEIHGQSCYCKYRPDSGQESFYPRVPLS
jgi:hypothetical protein